MRRGFLPLVTALAVAISAVVASSAVLAQDKPKLNLTIVASNKGFIVAGANGVIKAKDGSLPTIKCKSQLVNGHCPAHAVTRTDEGKEIRSWFSAYDYRALANMVKEIKSTYPD